MHPDLKLAVDLQVVDKEIARLSAEIAYLPQHIREIEGTLAGAQRQLDRDRAALAVNQQERKKLENATFPFQQKIIKYKAQVFDVKTNEEYKALQHEIEFAEGEIRKIEDQILERMIAAEELESRVKKAEKQLAGERVEVEREKAETTARTQADQEELARFRRQREEYWRQMSPEARGSYETGSRSGKRVAVAEVRDGTCCECHVRLRPQAFQEVKSNDGLRQCENCGRILVYVPPPVSDESPEPQPASNQGA